MCIRDRHKTQGSCGVLKILWRTPRPGLHVGARSSRVQTPACSEYLMRDIRYSLCSITRSRMSPRARQERMSCLETVPIWSSSWLAVIAWPMHRIPWATATPRNDLQVWTWLTYGGRSSLRWLLPEIIQLAFELEDHAASPSECTIRSSILPRHDPGFLQQGVHPVPRCREHQHHQGHVGEMTPL